MANGDIYQIAVHQSYQGQNLLNVFYYITEQDFGGTDANDLATEFLADVWAAVRACQVNTCNTNRIVVINGMTNADAVDLAVDLDGTNTVTTGLPAFISLALRSPKGSPGKRYSYKRIGGCPNEIGSDGKWVSGYITDIVAMTDNLGNNVLSAAGDFAPIQLQAQIVDGVKTYFKLGTVPQIGRLLTGTWQYNAVPSHQDTRQNYDWQLT